MVLGAKESNLKSTALLSRGPRSANQRPGNSKLLSIIFRAWKLIDLKIF